jgi:hypothetical protein
MSAVDARIETLQRNVSLGLRFRDVATGATAIDGLRVEVYPRHEPRQRRSAHCGPSGVYAAHALPGLRDFEMAQSDPPAPADAPWIDAQSASPSLFAPFRVEVRDPLGRYLPVSFDADLPVRGSFVWLAPWLSPPQPPPLPGSGSPPQLMDAIPLFSAPGRPRPEPLAAVYAQLRDADSPQPLAWSLLAVRIDGVDVGLGLADGEGRVAVFFPYPEPPRAPLASPPQARSDFRWTLTLLAYAQPPASPPAAVPAIPDLADVLGQLATPLSVLDFMGSPAPGSPAPPRRMEYRVPYVARTDGQPQSDASWLLVSTA